jgi:hypothetical protein
MAMEGAFSVCLEVSDVRGISLLQALIPVFRTGRPDTPMLYAVMLHVSWRVQERERARRAEAFA